MRVRDKYDSELTKAGCGRVSALKITEVPYCYTVEASYRSGKAVNIIPQIDLEDKFTSNNSELYY